MNNDDFEQALNEVLLRIADTRHDIKNPLSIISGNTQLLREMAHAMNLDDEFLEPLDDIGEATERIRDSLDQMDDLHDSIAEEREYIPND